MRRKPGAVAARCVGVAGAMLSALALISSGAAAAEPGGATPAAAGSALTGAEAAVVAAAGAAKAGTGASGGGAAGAGSELRFVRSGETVRTIPLAELRERCGARVVEVDDPYYGRRKSFRACPLAEVVRLGFGVGPGELEEDDVIFRASDGYAKPSTRARLAEDGGFVAYSDAELDGGGAPAWAPIDRKQVDPAPFYLVWTQSGQQDAHRYPWPYALVEIEAASLTRQYPATVPDAQASDEARAGFEVFRTECLACHSINGEGGKVGPELNVPQSIVEYRPAEQIKAYVRKPEAFRYTSMPAHEHLSDRQLDDLLAYFHAMSRSKRDPGSPP